MLEALRSHDGPAPEDAQRSLVSQLVAGFFSMVRRIPRELWLRRSMRLRIVVSFTVLSLCASALAGLVAVIDGRSRVDAETKTPLQLAARYIRETIQRSETEGQPPAALLRKLAAQLKHLRHATVTVLDVAGNVVSVQTEAPLNETFKEQTAPAWFASLVGSATEHRRIEITAAGKEVGSVLLEGNATEELNEVWNEFAKMGLVWLTSNAALMLVFYIALGRVLSPLIMLSRGMLALEHGHFMVKLDRPNLPELDPIVDRFNNLASALHAAKAENGILYGELISVQEEERKQIASELHDEAGPCLFGITTTTAAIEAGLSQFPASQQKIDQYLSEIGVIAQRLRDINRQIIKRLRPMALGQATIGELVTELISDFRRRYPDVQFQLTLDGLARSYGNLTDLTVYRCIQEGITNALKHGCATGVSIKLAETRSSAASTPTKVLFLAVSDSGKGIPPANAVGFGLTVMRERVQSLGGSWALSADRPSGATITASIPLPGLQPTAHFNEGMSS
jgi:two-component system, NarL family, sensor histidine kinase UhpB